MTESLDEDQKLLNVEGLIKLIEANSKVTASKRLENIVAKIRHSSVEQRDDITLMVVECCINLETSVDRLRT